MMIRRSLKAVAGRRAWPHRRPASAWAPPSSGWDDNPDQVLEWNQVFIDTLVATNTANSSSQRLGAIVHTAIFDAYNGIERRYMPVFVHSSAPRARRAERQSSPRRTRRWLACSRPDSRRSTRAMRLRSRR